MARSGPLLTEAQWKKIAPLLPKFAQAAQGRPPVDREPSCTGRDSVDFAERGSVARFAGEISAPFDLLAAAAGLGRAGRLVEHLAYVSGRVERTPAIEVERVVPGRQFCSGEKRGSGVGKTKRGKGTKWMVVVDGAGVPLGNHLYSASPAEVRLAETTLAAIRVGRRHRAGRPRQKPVRVIADKAYDSDPLRKRLAAAGNRADLPAQERIAFVGRRKMVEHCDDIGGDGSWNAPSLGRETSAVWSCAMTFAHNLSRVLSYRLLHDRLTEGCAIASSYCSATRLLRWRASSTST